MLFWDRLRHEGRSGEALVGIVRPIAGGAEFSAIGVDMKNIQRASGRAANVYSGNLPFSENGGPGCEGSDCDWVSSLRANLGWRIRFSPARNQGLKLARRKRI